MKRFIVLALASLSLVACASETHKVVPVENVSVVPNDCIEALESADNINTIHADFAQAWSDSLNTSDIGSISTRVKALTKQLDKEAATYTAKRDSCRNLAKR